MDNAVLKAELTDDTLVRGYSTMTDVDAAADLNMVYRTENKTSLTGSEVLNAIDKAEYNAKTDAEKVLVWNVLHLGNLNPFGIEADLLQDVFGVSTTITALQALRVRAISRAKELKLGTVRAGNIEEVRRSG